MDSQPARKRKHRILFAVVIGISIASFILFIYAIPVFAIANSSRVGFAKETWFCTRCGVQARTTRYSFFSSQLKQTGKLSFEPLLPDENCSHDPEKLGLTRLSFDLRTRKRTQTTLGFPNGDSFYNNPTLASALRTVAQTNRARAEIMVKDLYTLRSANADLNALLPSLQSGGIDSLIAELKSAKFNDTVMSHLASNR